MPRLEMLEPRTVEEAVTALSRRRAAVPLAGGTDLLPALRRELARPHLLVNLKHIPGLAGVRRVRGGVWIGALTTVAELLCSPLLAARFPVLVEAARDFGSPQIRTMATLGGNLCSAIPSADLPLPLLVLDARLQVTGPEGEREISVSEFFRGVGKTALGRGEILTAITLPRPPVHSGAACVRLTGRKAMDLATAAAAASITLKPDGVTGRHVRIALGAVGPTPRRAFLAEALLEGGPITPDLIAEASGVAARECQPITDFRASAEYRREMIEVLVRRAVTEACVRAEGVL